MQLGRHFLLSPLIRWLIGSLTALLLTLPALEGVGAAPLNRTKEEASHRALSFEERVAAQKAIEEVFWRHRIWPKENPGSKPALEEVLPDSVIRERVTDYLKESNALEKLWNRRLTAEQLQAEMERMAKNSRQPEVLREIFAALHDDPFLIAECLARPALSDRLLRNWYAFDDRFHGTLREEAQRALSRHPLLDSNRPEGSAYQETTWQSRPGGPDSGNPRDETGAIALSPEEYESLLQETRSEIGLASQLPLGRFGPLQENEHSFFAEAVVAQEADAIRIGLLSWSKTPFETWWSQERRNVDADLLPPEEDVRAVTLDSPPCVDDTWTPISFGPDARYLHSAVWTGSEMLVWGGRDINSGFTGYGLRYNPATDTWTPMNPLNAPSVRTGFTAIWTGTRMIIWGGTYVDGSALGTGGRYDPSTDTWSATSIAPGVPSNRTGHTVVWTGTEMIVWGGATKTGLGGLFSPCFNSGGKYNPSNDSWSATGTGSEVPSPRRFHSAAWTGSEMIVWGGEDTLDLQILQFNTGGRYNPGTDSWSTTSTGTNVPSARTNHTALWTGSRMIIYGGTALGGDPIGGARYNPGSDSWSTLNTPLYSSVRHAAVWTGSRMIVWGGYSSSPNPGPMNLGFRYNPSSDTYMTTNLATAPTAREQHTGVWTGTEMIVWGGSDTGAAALDTGGRYDPTSDSWIPTSRIPSPMPRTNHAVVWTGAEMIVWGGGGPTYVNTGGRYAPATDTWGATNSAAGTVPEGRIFHSAVWTGTDLIVWGGMNTAGTRLDSGGRYNPTSDSWAPTGTGTNLPVARAQHSAVWTGTEMIVWGGSGWTGSAPINLNSGGRYDPGGDAWMPTGGGTNLPTARSGQTATWTGDRMFVWGGTGSGTPQTTGGRYDPVSDSWSAVSTTGAPDSYGHTAVWTGSEVIVWAYTPSVPGNTGGRYNPASNTWSSITWSGVPSGRGGYTAVWANGEMIVWGGSSYPGSNALNTGGRYDPANDTWTPTGTGTNVPTPRSGSRAVWTGTEMLVWGGFSPVPLGTGARYCRQCATYHLHYRDLDVDLFGDPQTTQTTCNPAPPPGFVSTSGDCLDTNAAVYPGAPQICDGLNNNCSDPLWPAVPANEANADGDAFRVCQGDCDDTRAAVFPGAPQLCDGLNNDCLDGTWPTVPGNEADPDGDGYRICTPDCFEGNPQVWAAPFEVSGLAVLDGSPTTVAWSSQSVLSGPGTTYDLVGGTLTSPAGSIDFTAAACLQSVGPHSFNDARAAPAADTGYWYLARGQNSCGTGTYGSGRDGAIPPCP